MSKKFLYDDIDQMILEEYGIYAAYEKYCGSLTLEDIFTTDSVYLSAKQCASGFQSRPDTQAFMKAAWKNSQALCERVLNNSFIPGYYPVRMINERGKMRTIKPPYFECKVVQKVICNAVLRAVLEYRMIHTNYASVRGKGTKMLYEDVLRGLNQAKKLYRTPVIIMTDFTDFFGSINNDILEKDVFERYIKDRRITALLRSFSPTPHGLSLGNEVSQVPASFFPSPIDHEMKDRRRLKFYYRYADDILAIVEEDQVQETIQTILDKSRELDLTIKDEKIKIVPFGENFVYCKERFIFNKEKQYYYSLINPTIPRRQAHKIHTFARKVEEGTMDRKQAANLQKCVVGIIASHPNTYKTVTHLDDLFNTLIPEIHQTS